MRGACSAAKKIRSGATDTGSRLAITTLSGPASPYGRRHGQVGYFSKVINDQGGINGRKINLSRSMMPKPTENVEMVPPAG